jgi:V8-like Glu-specific endopeptidase
MQSRCKRALVIACVTLILAVWALPPAFAQPAPVRRAIVPADAAPEAMADRFANLRSGEQAISIPGAAWLQLQFSGVQLGPGGILTITSATGDRQSFSQATIEAWGGLTAIFNGSELRVTLTPGPGATEPVAARVEKIIIGLPPAVEGVAEAAPQQLIDLLGHDLNRFIPEDARRPTTRGAAPERSGEAICGATDDRVASNNPRSGRIMPVGCTGWLIGGGTLLTAGHCTGASMQTVEFNVPASQANGTTVSPPVRDQYRVMAGSTVTQNTGIGNDWAIFQVLPNTQTNLLPAIAQGATFQLSNTQNPANVRITGFGVDGPPPNFGAGGPQDTTNQTQQTHVGTLSTNTGGTNSGTLRYAVDTQGGNSGSPVIVEGSNVAIGIHTNAGCTSTGGTNAGTSFRNQALWTAIGNALPTSSVGFVWRYTGTPCSGESCPGWQLLDNNAATLRISAAGNNLYQLHNSGRIWRFTGTACSGESCPGWQMLDNNAASIGIVAADNNLYQLHNSGRIWRFTGTACSGESCPGWQMLDNNGATVAIVAAGNNLYQLHNSGRIWRFTGTACSGESCPGWQLLDNNGASIGIIAADNNLYQLHNSGRIWRFTGTACSGESCPGWQMLDNNGSTGRLTSGGNQLYQIHTARTPMARQRSCQECRPH